MTDFAPRTQGAEWGKHFRKATPEEGDSGRGWPHSCLSEAGWWCGTKWWLGKWREMAGKQRNFEQDWNAVLDVGEGCFLSPAQGNRLCGLTAAQPHVGPLGSQSASLVFTHSVGRLLVWSCRPGVPTQPQARGCDVPASGWRLALPASPPVLGLVNTSQGSPTPPPPPLQRTRLLALRV